MTELKFTTKTRNAIVILVVLCLALVGGNIYLLEKVQTLVKVDCAALEERYGRVEMYGNLADYWQSRDPQVAQNYVNQREVLVKTVMVGDVQCDDPTINPRAKIWGQQGD